MFPASRCVAFLALVSLARLAAAAQAPREMDAAHIRLALEKLNVLGRVLYLAAHPDDENTGLIAFWENGALYDAAKAGRAAAPAAMTEEERALLADPTARAMWALLETRFPGKLVSPSQSPQLDLGVDSLGWVEITLEAESRLGIGFSEDDWAGINTVRDILDLAIARAKEDRPARPPEPQTVAWYRLACSLPRRLPADAFLQQDPASRQRAEADYALIVEQLGGCPRSRT